MKTKLINHTKRKLKYISIIKFYLIEIYWKINWFFIKMNCIKRKLLLLLIVKVLCRNLIKYLHRRQREKSGKTERFIYLQDNRT